MKKRKITFTDLIEKNKEEILNDQAQLKKIEERLDAKHAITKKSMVMMLKQKK
ncbi:FbpB family small basic protein [Bacillus sp. B15-48]|uniref:FbpB family small basic protein n=1 Tax=Bacillus sp. B15-48 TaxID=1548601 RepID=UPI00193F7378|nr:FbpB family small basic protein [Bacillus sp. B15-48]MBM4765204.1 FbpB family small basic protein [Bacillus sp. B15-48]